MADENQKGAGGRSLYARAKHLVVDIETLGLSVPAPILSIGMVLLDCSGGFPAKLTTWTLKVDPKTCVGEPEEKTMQWWAQQSEAARQEAFEGTPDADPFGEFLKIALAHRPDYYWGKSHDFDFGHLGAQLAHLGKKLPWNYWRLRDIRTIEGLGLVYAGKDATLDELRRMNASALRHSALSDALVETELLYSTILATARRRG